MSETPQQVYLDVHLPCNLRCVQCHIWKSRNPSDELSLDERLAVIRELAAWSPSTLLYFSGGEVMGRSHALFRLIEEASRLGLQTLFTSNGTLFRPTDFQRLIDVGLTGLIISFDSDQPEVHDRVRGVPGTFARAMASLESMLAARETAGRPFVVVTSTIIHADNLDRLTHIVDLFEGLGVDRVGFNALQPTVKAERGPRWWEAPMFPRDLDALDAAIDGLVALARAGRRLHQSADQLDDIRRYYHRPWQLDVGHCGAHRQSMMINATGDVGFCFDMDRAGLAPVGNVREHSLRELWLGPQARSARDVMSRCTEGCGALSCHAR